MTAHTALTLLISLTFLACAGPLRAIPLCPAGLETWAASDAFGTTEAGVSVWWDFGACELEEDE